MVNPPKTLLYGLSALALVAHARPIQDTKSKFTYDNEPRGLENTARTPSATSHTSSPILTTIQRASLPLIHHANSRNDALALTAQVLNARDIEVNTEAEQPSDDPQSDNAFSADSATQPETPKKKKWYASKTFLGPAIGVPVAAALTYAARPGAPKTEPFIPRLGSSFGRRDGEVGGRGGVRGEDKGEKRGGC